ncbi:hypothetical protein GPECTOR_4g700 [Gonium pectorale]|uniref:EF-hand domain-containing protein n=1 Tax=Gonium pectorale TaxID=33097 RepID=A0A150GXU1_GONPE|nr:hypothetical protein GPECTOR_4g700 [Gonium pectorale]|eukprot:KXZ54635.1 hypothetical protein GPECTOR_4g700 [Gonium pectorale]
MAEGDDNKPAISFLEHQEQSRRPVASIDAPEPYVQPYRPLQQAPPLPPAARQPNNSHRQSALPDGGSVAGSEAAALRMHLSPASSAMAGGGSIAGGRAPRALHSGPAANAGSGTVVAGAAPRRPSLVGASTNLSTSTVPIFMGDASALPDLPPLSVAPLGSIGEGSGAALQVPVHAHSGALRPAAGGGGGAAAAAGMTPQHLASLLAATQAQLAQLQQVQAVLLHHVRAIQYGSGAGGGGGAGSGMASWPAELGAGGVAAGGAAAAPAPNRSPSRAVEGNAAVAAAAAGTHGAVPAGGIGTPGAAARGTPFNSSAAVVAAAAAAAVVPEALGLQGAGGDGQGAGPGPLPLPAGAMPAEAATTAASAAASQPSTLRSEPAAALHAAVHSGPGGLGAEPGPGPLAAAASGALTAAQAAPQPSAPGSELATPTAWRDGGLSPHPVVGIVVEGAEALAPDPLAASASGPADDAPPPAAADGGEAPPPPLAAEDLLPPPLRSAFLPPLATPLPSPLPLTAPAPSPPALVDQASASPPAGSWAAGAAAMPLSPSSAPPPLVAQPSTLPHTSTLPKLDPGAWQGLGPAPPSGFHPSCLVDAAGPAGPANIIVGEVPRPGDLVTGRSHGGDPDPDPDPDSTQADEHLDANRRNMLVFPDEEEEEGEEGEEEEGPRRPPWYKRPRVLWLLGSMTGATVLVAVGVPLQRGSIDQVTKNAEVFRWLYFAAGFVPTYWLVFLAVSRVFQLVEWMYFRENLTYLQNIQDNATSLIAMLLMLLWFNAMFHWLWCGATPALPHRCRSDTYLRATDATWKAVLCIMLFMVANVIKACGREGAASTGPAASAVHSSAAAGRRGVTGGAAAAAVATAVGKTSSTSTAGFLSSDVKRLVSLLNRRQEPVSPHPSEESAAGSGGGGGADVSGRGGGGGGGGGVHDSNATAVTGAGRQRVSGTLRRRRTSGLRSAPRRLTSSLLRDSTDGGLGGSAPAANLAMIGAEAFNAVPMNIKTQKNAHELTDAELERVRDTIVIKTYTALIRKHGGMSEAEQLRELRTVKRFARALFLNLRGPDASKTSLTIDDFKPFFTGDDDMARKAFEVFDADSSGQVSRSQLRSRVVNIYTERRNMARALRDTDSIVRSLELTLGVATHFLFGAIYLTIWCDSNIINIAAVLFMWSATTGFSAASYVPSLVMERGLFVRERNDGLYLAPTYLTAKLLDEIAINSVASLGISAFTFYGIQLQNSFGVFYVSYFVGVCVGIVMAYFVASFAPNMDVANALLPTYAVTLLFFAGFLIRTDEMPPWWKWYSYIDFAKYSWGAVMVNQFKHYHQPWIGGQTVLQYYSLDGTDEWAYIGYTSLFFLFFYICTALVLTFKQYQLR